MIFKRLILEFYVHHEITGIDLKRTSFLLRLLKAKVGCSIRQIQGLQNLKTIDLTTGRRMVQ